MKKYFVLFYDQLILSIYSLTSFLYFFQFRISYRRTSQFFVTSINVVQDHQLKERKEENARNLHNGSAFFQQF
jgi:hypothetical protein